MIDSLAQDYIRTAKAKGLSQTGGPFPPRAAQLAYPDGHAYRAFHPGRVQRRRDHRAVFNYPGVGLLFVQSATVRTSRCCSASHWWPPSG